MVSGQFFQTDIGPIPVGWKPCRVGDLVSFSGGSQPDKSVFKFRSTEGYVRLIQIRDYKTDKFETYIPESLVRKTCNEDDVMIGRYGPPIFQILRGIQGAYNVALIKASPSEGLDKDFFYHFIQNEDLFKLMEVLSRRSSGQTGVDLPALKHYPLPLPPLEEQIAIAKSLSETDAKILSLEKLINKKREIKTATMQQLLTGKKRLPPFDKNHKGYKQTDLGEIPKDWEVVELGNIGQTIIGLTYSPNNVVTEASGTLVLRSSNVQQNKLAFENNVFVIMNLPDRVLVKEGDILVCVRNGSKRLIGKCALIDKKTEGVAFGAFMSIYRTEFNSFIFFQFQSNIIQRQIDEIMGATINQITNKDMAAFKVLLPDDKGEQKAISDVLLGMDLEIDLLEQRLQKTKKLKQGMMQELLTGKTRLI